MRPPESNKRQPYCWGLSSSSDSRQGWYSQATSKLVAAGQILEATPVDVDVCAVMQCWEQHGSSLKDGRMWWRYPDSNQLPLRVTGPRKINLTAIFSMYPTTFRHSLGNSKYFKKSRTRPQKHPAVCERLWRSMDKEALFFVSLSWNYVVFSTYRGRHRTSSDVLGNWDGWPPHSVFKRLFVRRKYFLVPFEGPKPN